jgi:hypothetical protein
MCAVHKYDGCGRWTTSRWTARWPSRPVRRRQRPSAAPTTPVVQQTNKRAHPAPQRGEARRGDVVQSQVRARALVRHVRHAAWRTAVIRPQWNEQSAHYVRVHASATRSLESLEVQEVNAFDFGAGGDRTRQPHEGAPTSIQQFEADHRLTTHPPTNARPPSLGPPLLSAARPMLVCLFVVQRGASRSPTHQKVNRPKRLKQHGKLGQPALHTTRHLCLATHRIGCHRRVFMPAGTHPKSARPRS